MTRRRHTRKTLEQRFWAKVDRSTDDACWLWLGAKNTQGYGVLRLPEDGGLALAHRVSLRLDGRDPGALLARHSCDTAACVNPAHLLVGTHEDNAGDMVSRGRSLRGSRQPGAKLTEADVLAIRAAYDGGRGGVLIRELADQYGVAYATLASAISGYRWGHVRAVAA